MRLPAEALARVDVTAQEWDRVFDLLRTRPHACANVVLTWGQRVLLALLAAGVVAWFAADAMFCLTAVNAFFITFYLVVSVFKVVLIHHSLGLAHEMRFTEEEVASLRDEDLPVYTVLVPLYRETESLGRLVEGLTRLDYPKDKLDVLLLLEEDDWPTVEAARAMAMPPFIRLLVTPQSFPKTKPKACNLGMARARGAYLVIYDAEDRPDPDQLKKAVLGFRRAPSDVICLQAKLNFYNQRQNLLTRLFTIEYSMWFDLFLPGLTESGAPIPLGGTSNHFVVDRLRRVGGWDPFNVTEDCDLGVRVSREGYRSLMMDSTTWEEACSDLGFWVRQRSRWSKGYVQTFLVQMRRPLELARALGMGNFVAFLLVIVGTPLSMLVNPAYWLMTALWIGFRWEGVAALFPFPIILGGLLCLFLGNFVFVYAAMLAAFRRRYYDLVKYALLTPFYWLLMSVGAWKGFVQLITRPNYWEKTRHGFDLAAQARQAQGRPGEPAAAGP
jgi:cellulose synthase/poly-beta-1,6-N-acetylglucosamine synthase-like glycosyltransferase